MHDGIETDNRGKPAAVLITEPFIPTARAIAEIRALPDYRFAVLKHPIGSLNEDELRQRARDAAPQIIKILLGKE
ncbi:MAG: hypothetical protein HY787_04740 [Deltaproteobacteria bacterium]|nr:hypothetical protein [Deltaproteobacteria bacterium]